MPDGTSIRLRSVIILVALISQAVAHDEQWLQYRSQRLAHETFSDMGASVAKVTTSRPMGVQLPEFSDEEQFFASWPSPMAEGGRLWIALDRTSKRGPWDRLFVDSNGDGSLSDDQAVTAFRIEQYYTHFGPIKVVFETEDGPVTYHLNFKFYNYSGQNRRLYIYSGCWYEGTITVAGVRKHCTLIDHNANGTFDDKSLQPDQCDRIRIGETTDQKTVYVGNFIEIDSRLYRLEIARDGAYVRLTRAEDVQSGTVRMAESITEFSAGGENGLFVVKPEKGACSLPAGKYRVNFWAVERKDDQGRLWRLEAAGLPKQEPFDVRASAEVQLSLGEPIVSTIKVQNRDGIHSFRHDLKGRLGESIRLTRTGTRAQPPKLHIRNKDGTFGRTYSFAYG